MNAAESLDHFGTSAFGFEVMHDSIREEPVWRAPPGTVGFASWLSSVPLVYRAHVESIVRSVFPDFRHRPLNAETLYMLVATVHARIVKEIEPIDIGPWPDGIHQG